MIFSNKNVLKDEKQLLDIYLNFIKDYSELNKLFGFDNPIEMYVMFCYLLNRGFLSLNKEYKYSKNRVLDKVTLLGSNILSGKGVCRHISYMFKDILKESGVKCGMLPVSADKLEGRVNVRIDTNKEDSRYLSIEEMYDFLNKNVDSYEDIRFFRKEIDRLIESNKTFGFRCDKDFYYKENNYYLNHVINLAIKDDKSYFLDPTRFKMYRVLDTDKLRLCDVYHDRIFIKKSPMFNYLNSDEECKMMEGALDLPSVSREEEVDMAIHTLEVCYRNMDVFTRFYSEHSSMYKDVSKKITKIRKYK